MTIDCSLLAGAQRRLQDRRLQDRRLQDRRLQDRRLLSWVELYEINIAFRFWVANDVTKTEHNVRTSMPESACSQMVYTSLSDYNKYEQKKGTASAS